MKKAKQKLMQHRICSVARVMACASFLMLAIIGVSSLVRAMSLENVANEKGVPSAWNVASLGNPETITVPITYWDQRQDDCDDPDRQFEWSLCRLYAKGIIKNIVKNNLGSDGLPVPTYTNNHDAWNAYHDAFTANITGSDPVQTTDNFYRWFHETYDENGKQLSKQYDREVTFTRTGNNTYEYGSKGTFPLDDVDFSKDDSATKTGHNFHFTAHMTIPMKISADGSEEFWFSGDDDVWVFLNGQLVLDLGGLHMDTEGKFTIDSNGQVISTVNNVADAECRREKIKNPLTLGYDVYNNQVENSCPRETKTEVYDLGLKSGDVVNLDFFYAERSTSESNTRITITNMNWPISADSNVDAEIISKIGDTEKNLVQFQTSVTNRDTANPLDVERMAAYIRETMSDNSTQSGFLPLDLSTLKYTFTPNDPDSWQPIDISAPDNTQQGFNFADPVHLAPNGQTGDTVYFRYYGETSDQTGSLSSLVSYYTSLNGATGFTYDEDSVSYAVVKPDPIPNQLVIKYIYAEDKSEAHPPYNGSFYPGEEFSIGSPEIDGYTPDLTTVTGTMTDGNMSYTVEYSKIPDDNPNPPVPDEPEKKEHTVTIHYVYEDGTKAADDYNETYPEGEEFSVDSPDIEGYTPDKPNISDTANSDLEYTVTYTKTPTPVTPPDVPDRPSTPDQPDQPSDPAQPDNPNRPEGPIYTPDLPSSDIIDEDLVFVDPLGEVAYVPNTGIVDMIMTPLFGQQFADAILSQGFVLATLTIFAGSFAIYFSLRRYLDYTVAPAAATRAKMTSAKSMSAKSAKTAKTSKAKAPTKSAKMTASRSTARTISTRTATKPIPSARRSGANKSPRTATKKSK